MVVGQLRHRDRLLDRVPWRGDEVVLDVGAGAGLMAVGAARRVPRGRVLAVDLWVGKDLSGNGPDRLRRNAEPEGVADRVEVRTGDARALDLPDEPGRRGAAREIARVLRPGGHVVVGDLAGTAQLATRLAEEGIAVLALGRARQTFPPQRLLVARRPA